LKEEEACDRWRPNDESTSPRSSTLYATSHVGLMAKKKKSAASESKSEDESDDDEFNQHLARLSKKDKLMVLKLIEKIQEQEETLYEQEEFLINKIKCLEKLTKKHEKLKCSHASLVKRYENLSIEQTHTINSLSCVA
jgi:predicted DNA-binding ribbon-helix-helix protein